MAFWTEVHWSEGMFLRPHHLQAGQRWMETLLQTAFDAARPYPWGFLELQIAPEPLENFTLRLDRCVLRLKDGTWACIPGNTEVEPLEFKKALDAANGTLDLYLGIPQMQEVRPNSISIENPEQVLGLPRYEPFPITKRDENTGENPQRVYVRRMRGRLFVATDDMAGYDVLRIGRVRKTDRPGAAPELDELGAGPLLALQASGELSRMVSSVADQIEAKDEVLVREAREHRMEFTDGVASNMEHLLKLHAVNEARAHIKALLQSPVLHPFDVFVSLARLVGHLSIFGEERVPDALPIYDHDYPADALDKIIRRIVLLLEALRPMNYVVRPFSRQKDERGKEGLQVEIDRRWIDENLEIFVGFEEPNMDSSDLERFIRSTFDMKLASPSRAARIHGTAVSGLRFQLRPVPPGTLPRRQGLHYFKIDKTIGPDRTDYWRECEQERGIRMSMREGQMAGMERLKPSIYVALKGN